MSTYKRLQLDNNNLKDEENSNKLILQDKYLKYKYKYLKQKQIIQTGQRYKESLNLEGKSSLSGLQPLKGLIVPSSRELCPSASGN